MDPRIALKSTKNAFGLRMLLKRILTFLSKPVFHCPGFEPSQNRTRSDTLPQRRRSAAAARPLRRRRRAAAVAARPLTLDARQGGKKTLSRTECRVRKFSFCSTPNRP